MSRRQGPTEPSSGDCQGPPRTSTDRARLSAIQGRQIRIRTCRTAGACGFMTDTHDIANTTDEEFSDDDLIRLRKLENTAPRSRLRAQQARLLDRRRRVNDDGKEKG